MSVLFSFLLLAAYTSVAHSRVTFTHSEAIQKADLNDAKTANFKCENGCVIYSDSRDAELYINDGVKDLNSFHVLGPPNRSFPVELAASKNYNVVFRGKGAPPEFIFYAVDIKSPNIKTPVYVVNKEDGYLSISTRITMFTLLNSDETTPFIAFQGEFETGYPRIYATGYDATSEKECKPVYQARSKENALNSQPKVMSPIQTVVNRETEVKANEVEHISVAIAEKSPNSSIVYISPGYVGCSYTNQLYSTDTDTVSSSFSADVKSLDFAASVSIPTANEAVHITVNGDNIDLFNGQPSSGHYEDDRFDVSIAWTRIAPTSNFAIQFDLGARSEEDKSTRERGDERTTSTSGITRKFTLSPLLTVALIALW